MKVLIRDVSYLSLFQIRKSSVSVQLADHANANPNDFTAPVPNSLMLGKAVAVSVGALTRA